MNILRHTFLTVNSFMPKKLFNYTKLVNRAYSGFVSNSLSKNFLQPKSSLVEQVCGFKVKLKLQKRCKDCYIVARDGRKYVICPTHPRHKQMSMIKKPKYTWIITHASQSKVRQW